MQTRRIIGRPTPSIEGPSKVSGNAQYAGDVSLTGMTWCEVLRSPYPHARILHVDTSKAAAAPGVLAVITGKDVRGIRTGNVIHDDPLLAWDETLFVGDRVAAVCAKDHETAARALSLISVEYEELPAAFTVTEAIAESAPILHPNFNSYSGVEMLDAPSNIYGTIHHTAGSVDQGFIDADVTVERWYSSPRAHQMYFEPHTCLVSVADDGSAQVWFASGTPGLNRDEIARTLGLPVESIVVNFSLLGGSYGGKTDGTEVVLCYLLSKSTGRPVKYVAGHTQELTAMHPRNPSDIRIKAGVKRDGTLTAWEAELYFTTGAYAGYTLVPTAGGIAVSAIAGPYKTPNVKIDSHQIYANTVACGYMRGPGPFQCTFACESHMDVIASELGIAPAEIRRKNLIQEPTELRIRGIWNPSMDLGAPSPQTVRIGEALETALQKSGYAEPKANYVGRGIAIDVSGEIGGDAHTAVVIHSDGRITVSLPTYGPGIDTYTTLAQVVAEELGVSLAQITAEPWSSVNGLTDAGLGGDRGARVITLAGVRATNDLKQQLVSLAAELLGWEESTLTVADGSVVNSTTGQRVPLTEMVEQWGEPVKGSGDVDEPWDTEYASFSAHVAEVAVDPETGNVELIHYTAVQETGQIINPTGFYGQIFGGISQGFGQGTMEELVIEGGRVTTATLADYKIPSIGDMPRVNTIILDSTQGHGKYNVRGIGNKSICLPAPAIANAIADACGARILHLPLTAEKVYQALRTRP
jgi:CO/xanthine dehydrogenase Mo-binding subunit